MVHHHFQRIVIGFGAHGADNRAKDFGLVDVHIRGDIVKQMRANEEAVFIALQFEITVINHKGCALVNAALDQAQNTLFGLCRDNRTVIHIIAIGVGGNAQFFHPWHQFFKQAVSGAFAYWDSNRNRHAAFASGAKTGPDDGVGGLVHIGVRHDDHVVFCATKALRAFAVGCGAAVDVLRNRGRANEGNTLNDVVVQQRVNRFVFAVHNLKNPFGQAGFDKQFGQHHRNGRVALGGFQHNRVAAGQRWRNVPKRHHGRKVERHDRADNTQWLTHGIHIDAGARTYGVFAFQKFGSTNAIFHNFQTALNVAFGIGNGFTMFAAKGFGQFIHVTVQQANHGHHYAATHLWVLCTPRGLCSSSSFDRCVHFGGRGQIDFILNFAGGGVHDVALLARGAFDHLAVDKMSDIHIRILRGIIGFFVGGSLALQKYPEKGQFPKGALQ